MNTLLSVIILILLIVLIYVSYLYFFKSRNARVIKVKDASSEITIPASKLQNGPTENYTYSLWLNILDYNMGYGSKKCVLYRESQTSGKFSPLIYLDENMNNLVVQIDSFSDTSKAKCTINNVPLQSWFNVIVTLNSRSLDIYYNGKLIKSCLLFSESKERPVEYKSTNPLVLCSSPDSSQYKGGFSGEIGNIEFFANAVSPNEAYAIYKHGLSGINTSVRFNYKLNAGLLKNGKQIASTQISL